VLVAVGMVIYAAAIDGLGVAKLSELRAAVRRGA
jgi:hypothetical protein